MIIKIDVDGVIRDIISAMCEIYNARFGGNLCVEDIDDYDINTNFPKIMEEMRETPVEYFFTHHGDDIFEYVSKPFEGVKDSIDKLCNFGHKVVIVTWQFSLKNIIHTLRFLDKYGIRYHDICFTKDKWMIRGDYLIDDNPEFIMDKRDKSSKIVIDTPYNRHISKKYRRAGSLEEAVDIIINETLDKSEAA